MEDNFRHEYKYLVSETALKMLEMRLKGIMKRDIHAGESGKYLIRSVYFDDIYDTSFRENADGMDRHEKYRIRAYNGDPSFISLEMKIKERGKTKKLSETIDKDLYRYLCFGEGKTDLISSMGNLSRKIMTCRKTRGLKPKIIVQYEREPYIMDAGNVRVTFDRYISASTHIDRMFEKNTYAFPVMPEGIHLLEVKWDDFLPGVIRDAISNDKLRHTSFSKYYLVRNMAHTMLS